MATETCRTLSEREGKLIRSLRQRKNRDANRLFIAETPKVVSEMLPCFETELLVTTEAVDLPVNPECRRSVSPREMKRLSLLEMPSSTLALFRIPPQPKEIPSSGGIIVALDAVQNPGNLGTIIRLCDWLGLRMLILGEGTTDPYGPKVVQATAGVLGSLRLHYGVDLPAFLRKTELPIYAADLDGEPIGRVTPPEQCVVLFGNEGHGFRPEVKQLATHTILIPKAESAAGDSLNVALSAAIILSHFAHLI